jgi:hypothetical protein
MKVITNFYSSAIRSFIEVCSIHWMIAYWLDRAGLVTLMKMKARVYVAVIVSCITGVGAAALG